MICGGYYVSSIVGTGDPRELWRFLGILGNFLIKVETTLLWKCLLLFVWGESWFWQRRFVRSWAIFSSRVYTPQWNLIYIWVFFHSANYAVCFGVGTCWHLKADCRASWLEFIGTWWIIYVMYEVLIIGDPSFSSSEWVHLVRPFSGSCWVREK